MLLTKKVLASREELVYQAVKESVLAGQFRPNEVINQAEVARQLGVSIIPVRGAISRLVAEGLLVQDPYHSPHIPALTRPELEEILVICMHLEVLATKEAIPLITPEAVAELRALLGEMSAALAKNEMLPYAALNRSFHMAIYQNCPFPRLQQMIAGLWDKADINHFRAMFDLVPDLAGHTQADHVRLVELIETKQVEEAVKLMEAHKTYSRTCFLIAYEHQARQAAGDN